MRYLSFTALSSLVALLVSWAPVSVDGSAENPATENAIAESQQISENAKELAPAHGHSDEICSGGVANLIDASLQVTRFNSSSTNGDSLSLGLELESHYDKDARLIASVEVFDDRGVAITGPKYLPVRPLAVHGQTAFDFDTPAGLGDGFYRIIANIASETDDRTVDSFDHTELHIRVSKDGIVPISHDEWLLQSGANLAVQSFDNPDPEKTNKNHKGMK